MPERSGKRVIPHTKSYNQTYSSPSLFYSFYFFYRRYSLIQRFSSKLGVLWVISQPATILPETILKSNFGMCQCLKLSSSSPLSRSVKVLMLGNLLKISFFFFFFLKMKIIKKCRFLCIQNAQNKLL